MIPVYERLKRICNALLPAGCVLCAAAAEHDRHFCPGCERALPRLMAGCPTCAAPAYAPWGASPASCGRCQRAPPAYARVRAPFRYAAPIDRLVQGAKYAGRLDWLALLAHRLHLHVGASPDVDLMVPVPLHRTRLRNRGYNQSLELARPAAKALGLPLRNALVRVRATPPQTGLTADERRANLRRAFAATVDLTGARIALVDDVMTSGATVEAAAASLREAGAVRVDVWVVARA